MYIWCRRKRGSLPEDTFSHSTALTSLQLVNFQLANSSVFERLSGLKVRPLCMPSFTCAGTRMGSLKYVTTGTV